MRSAVIKEYGLVLLVNALFMFISVVASILTVLIPGFSHSRRATITVTVGALPLSLLKPKT